MSSRPDTKPANSWGFWVALVIILLIVRGLSGGDSTDTDIDDVSHETLVTTSEESPSTLTVENKHDAVVRRAALHAGRVFGALGSTGAERYSELCYEALAADFSVKDRNRCYSFDLLAARLIVEDGGVVPYRLTDWNIRSRWQDAAGTTAVGSTDRSEVEDLAEGLSVTAIAPPRTIPADFVQEANPSSDELSIHVGIDPETFEQDLFAEEKGLDDGSVD